MARSTQALSTGLKILSGQDVPVYTLEYLTPTKKHAQGSFEKIVIPYIELGRGPKCAVSFGEDFPTVSRRHASIAREGKEAKIKNLSATNPLLINGRPVNREFFLSSGDEIQLSLEGPRMRFNTSASGTSKMGFTNKLNLVIQQAIKPYKSVAIFLFAIFLLSTSGLSYALLNAFTKLEIQETISSAQADELVKLNQENQGFAEKIIKNNDDFKNQINRINISNLREREENEARLLAIQTEMEKVADSLSKLNVPEDFSIFVGDVQKNVLAIYFVSASLTFQGSELWDETPTDPQCMCTGFMLDGGKFVTARHCVDIFASEVQPEYEEDINQIDFFSNSGGNLTVTFRARSFDGSIDFTFTNKDMIQDFSRDELYRVSLDDVDGVVRVANFHNGSDFAYKQINLIGGLNYSPQASISLETARELHVLGYPDGVRFRADGDMRPDYNKGIVRRTGLTEGVIRGIQGAERGGNSGGPVFILQEDGPAVIGIVTGAMSFAGEEVFQVYTPISTVN
ncbi:MAG: FHA domain-containing protein [Algoriphagus sp.]|uniref:FHA domain-containing protein n=1 Tax=Algoriphagus sp. TaxID=1872435 RepID=UPI00261AB7A3|nr:FHA domain-containing protein [Algoriphagus sp.]MDG1279300.1 FHA domain-containing protein [Algoriphagus sp.]